MFTISPELTSTLIELRTYLVPMHILGVALGLGGVAATDVLFLRALKDKKISDDELYLLKGLSLLIWGGVVLLLISGSLLALPTLEFRLQNPAYIAKMTGVAVLLVNGILLNVVVTPALTKINFAGNEQSEPRLARLKMLAFTLGGVSATSWYSTFALAFILRAAPEFLTRWPIWSLALIFLGLVGGAIIGGYTFYRLQFRYFQSR